MYKLKWNQLLYFCVHANSTCPLSLTSVSSYDKNQAYSTEWSDDEQPAGYSGNETNGGGNSFEDDTVSRGGMRVRALYDYEGQEQDELSFKAGKVQLPKKWCYTITTAVIINVKADWSKTSPCANTFDLDIFK